MVAEHEEMAFAALAKLGLPAKGVADWDQLKPNTTLVLKICDAIVAEIDQVLLFERDVTTLRLVRPPWREYLRLSIGYYLGLYREDATETDVHVLKHHYTSAINKYLSEDTDTRLRRLRAAVCRAVEDKDRQTDAKGDPADAMLQPATSTKPDGPVADLESPELEVPVDLVSPPKPSWNYLPVPEGLDPHTEFAVASAPGVGGLRMIGARVRGKKHKHEGTNCDDWFQFGSVGAWNLIAVSDGAGSKKYSRVGAKAACEAAILALREGLANVKVTVPCKTPLDVFFAQEPDRTFKTNSIEHIQKQLHLAMQAAHAAVDAAYKDRRSGDRAELYSKTLERELELADLSCTLLIAVQTAFVFEGQEYSFILACQVGDGMTAAIYDTAGGMASAVLGSADSGAFSGETEFLTSKGKVELENLRLKTQSLICRLNALMVMTDGVADDYFPNSTEAPRLFADLVLTGVLGTEKEAKLDPEDRDLVAQARAAANYVDVVQTVELEPKDVSIASAGRLAETLGLAVPVLITKPAVLAELAIPISDTPVEERLRQWIDAYQVRGSFDDRTLVILYKDGPA